MDKFGIIALDIDGTIKGDSNEISTKTKKVLSQCKNLGAILVLATGRSYRSTQQIVSQLDNLDYVISFQGAQINKIGNDEILWNKFLPKVVVPEVLNFFSKFNTEKVAYVNDDIYVEQTSDWLDAYAKRNQVDMHVIESFDQISDQIIRLLAVGDDEIIGEMDAEYEFRASDSFYATRSLPHFFEVLSPSAGKEKALQWLCEKYGFTNKNVISFGNGFNDVPMISWSGKGVALKNSVPEVLKVANDITETVEYDGVARYLESMIENGLIGNDSI